MITLSDLRIEIDALDRELTALLAQRLELSRLVAQCKASSGERIYNPVREKEILDRIRASADPSQAERICKLFLALMRQSRNIQYLMLAEGGRDASLLANVCYENPLNREDLRVAYQGIEGAWSHIAATAMTPSKHLFPASSFSDVLEEIRTGRADVGILPLENSTAGLVSGVTECIEKYGYYLIASHMQQIDQCLASVPGACENDIRTVYSHPQALSQCSAYIASHALTEISCSNTAVAARRVAMEGIPAQAVICSKNAADLYGLAVIVENINNNRSNTTRFVAVGPRFAVPSEGGRISLAFTLPHVTGSLVSALSVFSEYEMSLSGIHSRPIPDKPWEYRFYADFAGSLRDMAVRALLLQLECELPSVSILGCYRELQP